MPRYLDPYNPKFTYKEPKRPEPRRLPVEIVLNLYGFERRCSLEITEGNEPPKSLTVAVPYDVAKFREETDRILNRKKSKEEKRSRFAEYYSRGGIPSDYEFVYGTSPLSIDTYSWFKNVWDYDKKETEVKDRSMTFYLDEYKDGVATYTYRIKEGAK